MNVCKRCSQFGKTIAQPVQAKPVQLTRPKPVEETKIQTIVPNCATLIKKAREDSGLKQEEFAKSISEKTSLVHNLESGRFKPPIELARKLERFLKITLVEQYEEKKEAGVRKGGEGLTIGDVIDLK